MIRRLTTSQRWIPRVSQKALCTHSLHSLAKIRRRLKIDMIRERSRLWMISVSKKTVTGKKSRIWRECQERSWVRRTSESTLTLTRLGSTSKTITGSRTIWSTKSDVCLQTSKCSIWDAWSSLTTPPSHKSSSTCGRSRWSICLIALVCSHQLVTLWLITIRGFRIFSSQGAIKALTTKLWRI